MTDSQRGMAVNAFLLASMVTGALIAACEGQRETVLIMAWFGCIAAWGYCNHARAAKREAALTELAAIGQEIGDWD